MEIIILISSITINIPLNNAYKPFSTMLGVQSKHSIAIWLLKCSNFLICVCPPYSSMLSLFKMIFLPFLFWKKNESWLFSSSFLSPSQHSSHILLVWSIKKLKVNAKSSFCINLYFISKFWFIISCSQNLQFQSALTEYLLSVSHHAKYYVYNSLFHSSNNWATKLLYYCFIDIKLRFWNTNCLTQITQVSLYSIPNVTGSKAFNHNHSACLLPLKYSPHC